MIQGLHGLLALLCSYREETVMEVEAGGVEGTGLQCTYSTHGCCLGSAGGQQEIAPGKSASLLWARSCSASGSSSSRTRQRERGP